MMDAQTQNANLVMECEVDKTPMVLTPASVLDQNDTEMTPSMSSESRIESMPTTVLGSLARQLEINSTVQDNSQVELSRDANRQAGAANATPRITKSFLFGESPTTPGAPIRDPRPPGRYRHMEINTVALTLFQDSESPEKVPSCASVGLNEEALCLAVGQNKLC